MQASFMLLLLSIFFAWSDVWGAQLLSIEQNSQSSSIFLLFNTPVSSKIFTLNSPDRFVIDFPDSRSKVNLKKLKLVHPLIKNIRIGYPGGSKLRVVIEADRHLFIHRRQTPCGYACIALDYQTEKKLKEIVLKKLPKSIKKTVTPVAKKVEKKLFKSASKISLLKPEEKSSLVNKITEPPVIIALDPGHGGKDPGAIGHRGYVEKNITLMIAKRLQRLINATPGMKAILTRDNDKYLHLRRRLQIARQSNADVFISIHADAFINSQSKGASVFALSQAGATSEAARWLAEKENYSELGGVNLAGLDDETGLVRTVLLDLSQTATISASLDMGTEVLNSLKGVTLLHHSHVEQARFMVLKSPDIPSILIETGFISNPKEEIRLQSESYQNLLTTAIMDGIKQYVKQYPLSMKLVQTQTQTQTQTKDKKQPEKLSIKKNQLQGTLSIKKSQLTGKPEVVNRSVSTIHKVQSGESLSKIALKYHLSVTNLKQYNHMTTTMINTGQKIIIPAK